MGRLSLIHLGDIHYPIWSKPNIDSDLKDRALDAAFLSRVGPNRLRQALDHVVQLIDSRPEVVGLLFAGDLTDKARIDGYRECVDYMQRALQATRLWKADSLFVVPGNHDVDRTQADPGARVAPLQEAWRDRGLDVLATSGVRSGPLEYCGNKAVVYALNSCLGCGEKRHLPEGIRAQLGDLLDRYITDKGSIQAAFEVVGEQLDTPAFEEEDLAALSGQISRLPLDVAPVVLAHHGILPQGLLRVDLYTEVINGGVVRFRFRDLEHPIIYCHGHIHENPIEVLRDPLQERRPVVLVSAPLLRNGFNLITIVYGRSGAVLGVQIEQIVVAEYGGIRTERDIRIPLVEMGSGAVWTDELGEAVGELCGRPGMGIRFSALAQQVREREGESISDSDVRERLEELEWLGAVRIDGRDQPHDRWIVRRIRP